MSLDMTPEDWDRIKDNSVYIDYSTGKLSAITVADLVTSIKAVRVNSPESLSLIKFLYNVLEIVQKDSDGRSTVAEQYGSSTNSRINYILQLADASKEGFTESGVISQRHRRIMIVPFTSDASGNLAADVELVPAKASYYGILKWIGLFSKGNAGGTGTLVVQDGSGDIANLVSGTLAAGQLDTKNEGMYLTGDNDNSAIFLDTTSAGLGNAQDYLAIGEYHYET